VSNQEGIVTLHVGLGLAVELHGVFTVRGSGALERDGTAHRFGVPLGGIDLSALEVFAQ
jgi:hypothetical protein